jgi:DNA-binding PadR family transcriptional regulator
MKINNNIFKQTLLQAWEDSYKKGFLSFWLLLALKDNKLYTTELQIRIQALTQDTINCENQSLYRSLRKYYDLEIVDFEMREGNKGPERKYYFLTKLGQELLQEFIERYISLFYSDEIIKIINPKTS